MNWIQVHLALNHVPVIGFPILGLLLIFGWWWKNDEILRLALWSIAILSIAAIAIKFTGDFAFEQSPGQFVSVKDFVSRHEQAADQATTGVFFLGLGAALALFLARRAKPFRSWTLVLVLVLWLATMLLYTRTAHSGGQISHPELRA